MANPKNVTIFRDGGTANMGDVSDETVTTARFRLHRDKRYTLVFVRGTFTGSGSGTAALSLKVDSAAGSMYDHTLDDFGGDAVGIGALARLDVPESRQQHFVVDVGDDMVFEWTNPDSPNITWALEIGLTEA